MVEVAGIEPACPVFSQITSTCIVWFLVLLKLRDQTRLTLASIRKLRP